MNDMLKKSNVARDRLEELEEELASARKPVPEEMAQDDIIREMRTLGWEMVWETTANCGLVETLAYCGHGVRLERDEDGGEGFVKFQRRVLREARALAAQGGDAMSKETVSVQAYNELSSALEYACLWLQQIAGYKCPNGDECHISPDIDPATCPPGHKSDCLADYMEAVAAIAAPGKPTLEDAPNGYGMLSVELTEGWSAATEGPTPGSSPRTAVTWRRGYRRGWR